MLTRLGTPPAHLRVFERLYGLRTTAVVGPDEDYEHLLLTTAGRARPAADPALVLYGHTLLTQPMALRTGFPGRLRDSLALPATVPVHGISQMACTAVLRCVELAARHLERPGARPDETVLVLGGDQGSIADRSRVIPLVTVAGDSATAFTVRRGPGRYRVLGQARGRDTRFHANLRMTPDETRAFGRACGEQLTAVVAAALADAGLRQEQADLLLPHQNNELFWNAFCTATGYPRDRVHLDLLGELGHNYGNDALIALDHADRTGRLRPGQRCVLTAIGQGAYFHALVLQVGEEE